MNPLSLPGFDLPEIGDPYPKPEPAAIEFTVPGVPVSQPRQRHRIIKTKSGGGFVQNYTPKGDPVNAFKASVARAAADAYEGAPLRGPIELRVTFVFPRPSSLIWKKKPMPRRRHTSKPDADNVLKAIKDAISGIVWADDSQVCDTYTFKRVASGSEQPHTIVRIVELPEEAES